MRTQLITALCTPLTSDHALHCEGLEAHIEDQYRHGIERFLVAGTMGLMQLQTDQTYRDLVTNCVHLNRRRGELLVGVGDTCFARTRDRLRFVEQFDIDGVVVLSPFLWKFTQAELIDYFRALADDSTKPIYMYDLPQLVGIKLEFNTVVQLSKHPNIRGAKCSGAWEDTRQLIDYFGDRFRIVPAQPHMIDHLVRAGVQSNLDGIFGVAPSWTVKIVTAAERGDWAEASRWQSKLSALLRLVRERPAVFGVCEAILNARGIPGRLPHPPMRRLDEVQRVELLAEPIVQELLSESTL